MTNEIFKRAIFEALTQEYENSIPNTEEHIFSPKFEKEMSRLIKRREKPYYKIINTFGKRAACFTVGILVASSLTIMNVEALREAFIKFVVNVFEKFSIVQSVDANDSPETIEDIYEITYDLSGYSYDLWSCDDISRLAEYTNGEIYINFGQHIKAEYDVLLNTENADIEIIKINGHEAIYYMDNHNYHHIIWDNDDYIISLGSNIGKTTLIDIADSVQKVE